MTNTKKVLDLEFAGFHLVCIMVDRNKQNPLNPFRVYRISGGHKRQIAKYGDFMSVLYFLLDIYKDGADSFPLHELIDWCKQRGSIY